NKYPGRRVLIRFPLLYKIRESIFPSNIDEKLYYKAAIYIWTRDNYPNIPIPYL
ncbi:hypothetical protein F5882DRAFT_310554, partial [Hyaloscypha sp. PMI_1271]